MARVTLTTQVTGTTIPVTWGNQVKANDDDHESRIVTVESASTTVLQGVVKGLEISNSPDDPNDTIIIQPGQITDDTNTEYLTLSSIFYKNLLATFVEGAGASGAGNSVGGLDTGTVAINTWYYPYVIKKTVGGNTDVIFSTSQTTPTVPAGWEAESFTGDAFLTDGSGNIVPFIYINGMIKYKAQILDFQTTITTTQIEQLVSIPPNYVGNFGADFFNSSGAFFLFQELSKTNSVPSGTNYTARTSSGAVIMDINTDIQVDSASKIGLRASASSSSGTLYSVGFYNPKR